LLCICILWPLSPFTASLQRNPSFKTPNSTFFLLATISSTLAFALLLGSSPEIFLQIAAEDSWIENITALFLLSASIAVFFMSKKHEKKPTRAFSYIIAAALLFCAMEEISWAQRIFGIQTPKAIAALNQKHEMNLHNLATAPLNVLYYFASFTFLILVPYINDRSELLRKYMGWFTPLAGCRYTLFGSVFAFVYAGYSWNTIPMQFETIGAFFILLCYLHLHLRDCASWLVTLSYLLTAFWFVGSFSTYFYTYKTRYLLGEYKEMYIALGYFIYALELRNKVKIPA
jgi:hypothetical protein